MNAHRLRTLLAFGTLLMLTGWNSVSAQHSAAAATVPSASISALTASGTTLDSNGSMIVARAIYVKLRPGTIAGTASATVLSLAAQAGISAQEATPMVTLPKVDEKLNARMRTLSTQEQNRINSTREDITRIVEVYYTADLSPLEAAKRMMHLPQVDYAEPIPLDVPLGPYTPNDPLLSEEWQLEQIKAPEAWGVWRGDTTMTIAIVDAGIDNTHEDLVPNIQPNPGESGLDANGMDKRYNNVDDDNNGVVDDWKGANLTWDQDNSQHGDTRGSAHGTQVAGLAAAMPDNGIGIAGIAGLCRLFPVKTAPKGAAFLTRNYQGLVYSAIQGHKVINLSWGSPSYSQAQQDLVTTLVTLYDVAIVAAGGNDAIYGPRFPAGYRHVLGVGALDQTDTFRTTWGEQIDISAPSGYTTSDDNQYFGVNYATSYTSPIVSGVVALVRSKWPELTADQAVAHVRLTADTIDFYHPGKQKLIGYGRVNAYRAVSTDPFSHPAVVVDSVWLVDEAGMPTEGFRVGERGEVRVRLKNLLKDVQNLKVTMVNYTGDSVAVKLEGNEILIPELKTNQLISLSEGFGFQVIMRNDQLAKLRFVFSADGYDDYAYEQTLIYKPFITARTPLLKLSLTDKGRIGYEDFPTNRVGNGVTYNDIPFLYEGGLIVASDAAHVLSNIRGADASVPDRDFTTVELPTAENDSTLLLNDSGVEAARRIGIELRMRTFTRDTVPDAVGVEIRARNISGATIDSLRLAMFSDWDLADDDQGQSITYVKMNNRPVAFYGSITGPSQYVLAQGVADPTPLPIFYALNNGMSPVDIYYNFGYDKKWITVSAGVGSPTSGPSDVSLIIGKRIAGLAPGAEDTTRFAIGISTSTSKAYQAIERLLAKPAATSSVAAPVATTGEELGSAMPNPFSSRTSIPVMADRSATLRIFDALGRMVADLSDQLPHIATPVTVMFDATGLPDGLYHIRLTTGSTVISRQIVVVR